MKLLVLTAFIAAVASGPLDQQNPEGNQWPWQAGKQYNYEVLSHTLAHLPEGAYTGNAFKAKFTVRVKSPGRLQARVENPQNAQVHQKLFSKYEVPTDLKFQPVQNLDKPFEISVSGGRVLQLTLPTSISLPHENLLKGLISALQVDLSTYHLTHDHQDSYDKESKQGVFKKMETDITGDCETLYSVSPILAEWRRELPRFASEEDPIVITKSKNHGHCQHRVAYHFGVPQGAEWTGTAHKHDEKQFITHSLVSRILAGKNGPIYKSEMTSSVYVHPHMYGKQKAEVTSYVKIELASVQEDNEPEWQKPEAQRQIKNLYYAMTTKQIAGHDQSSSSSSSSESHEYVQAQLQQRRSRRSTGQQGQVYDKSSSSSSSSSSSDSSSAYVNDDVPSINEPIYTALYMTPQARGDKKQNSVNAQKILQDIAQQLQNPNTMPKADFLAKFNILVRIIASMSTEQLSQTSRSIEVAKSSSNQIKADMWMIFRDAVAQSGTPPAFQQIKSWIQAKKIQGEEAAQVVASLAGTLRYPTKEIMTQFFELAMSPEVREERFLNSSALLAATKLIRLGQVDNATAHSYYPTHMYGRLARKHDRFVVDEILPRLAQELKQAIEAEKNSQAQVYVEAIANLGHREVLQVFAPYLEGRTPVSKHLRVKMVIGLRRLAQLEDKYVRAALYSILRNTAEPYEVRVAAILNIFRANPTSAMMQVMAQMTENDPSVNVRSALKSGIEFAAELKHPRYWHISKNAKAVRDMVTNQDLGYRYSVANFIDNFEEEENTDYFFENAFIGAKGSLLPKHQTVSWKNQDGGWTEENSISTTFSSVQKLLEFAKYAMYQYGKSDANHKYSAKKISEMLKLKQEPREKLEASFFVDIFNNQRFFAFDEGDLSVLVNDIRDYLKEVEQGVDKHYTKVFYKKQVSVMFPVAMGVPFIYKYKEPSVIHIQSKAKGKIDNSAQNMKDVKINMDKEIQFTWARNLDGSVGFMDTLSNHYASAGVENKLQISLPFKMNIDIKSKEAKVRVEPLNPEQDTTLVHYSVWPYTAYQKKESLVTTSQDPSTKLIERPRKVVSVDTKWGQQTGTFFQLQGYSYSADYRTSGLYQTENLLISYLPSLLAQKDIALTHYNFRYLGKSSPTKAMAFTIVYDKYYNQKQSGELGQASELQDTQPNSEARRAELAKRVAAGINVAKAQVLDLSATFEGAQKYEYVLSAAYADSPVDRKIQAALFTARTLPQHGKEQLNAVAKMETPEVLPIKLEEALKQEIKIPFEVDIKYGQNGHISLKAEAERTQKQAEILKEHPLAKKCERETSEGNYYQLACHKTLIRAYAPDKFKGSLTYKDVSPAAMNATYQIYLLLKNANFWQTDVNVFKKTPEGKIEMEADVSYVGHSARFEMTSKDGLVRINNVPISDVTPYALSVYRPFTIDERISNYYTTHQYQPFCSVDGGKIRTFGNRRYPYSVSRSWHVVMHDEANEMGKWNELVILARRPSEKIQEVYISYKSETGKDLEIEIKPQAQGKPDVQVKTNAKKISEGDLTVYWDDAEEVPLLQYHSYPDGFLMLNIREGYLRLMQDGQRLVILPYENRDTTRGICGRNSGERHDDFKTPEGIVDRPEHYGASYALEEENPDPKTQELKREAQQNAYQPQQKYTNILRSDEEWQKAVESRHEYWGSQNVYKTRSYKKQQEPCKLQQQVQYHENHGEICITTTPLASCQSHCQAEDYKVQAAQVICGSRTDPQFRSYRDQIRQGQNPEVSGVPKVEQYRVPTSCKA